jgi:GTP-binding protein HflX
MTDDTMSLVSWIHDHGLVKSVDYGDQVVVEFEARPAVVERSRAKAGELVEASA